MTIGDRDYTIQALGHALHVLESFLETDRAVQGVSGISESLGLNKSRVFRILNTLEQHRFVEQDPNTKQYRLGLRLMAFGDTVRRRLDIVMVAGSILDDLAERSGETVHLSVLDGDEAMCVAKRESKHGVRLYAEVGRRVPLHVGGTPKVLLAYMPQERRDQILRTQPLARLARQTITDPDTIESILAQTRRDGYNISRDDLDPGAQAVAAPIRDHTGEVIAAISVAGPQARFTPDKVAYFLDLVPDSAETISRKLGYHSPPQDED